MKFKIDNLQYCNWSRKIFEINREAGLDAVHVTLVYHEDFDEFLLEVKKWEQLFNDNSEGRLFNYFWLVDNCSEKASECESLNIADPTNQYWADDGWCNDEENCNGRQKAPVCPSERIFNLGMEDDQDLVTGFFNDNNYIGGFQAKEEFSSTSIENSKRDFDQAFNIISSKYI